jgi:hypothetical protein
MNKPCGYVGDRESALIGYLYEGSGPPGDATAVVERVTFEAHLAGCAICTRELDELRSVRRGLLSWSPPEHGTLETVSRDRSPSTGSSSPWRKLGEIPAWAQVAAALLVLGVSAGIANLDVRYDDHGLTIRTGWSRPSTLTGPIGPIGTTLVNNTGQAAPWRTEMTALEERMRADVQALRASSAAASRQDAQAARSLASDPELMRKVTALVKESERRQQSELALRVASVLHDVNDQRQSDLLKIDYRQREFQDKLGTEVLKQRSTLNYLINASQTR